MKEIKALVIDDEVAEKIKENLEDFKFRDTRLCIEAVETGRDAIDRIIRSKEGKKFYDVVIVDMKMDDCEEQGLEILRLPLSAVKIVFTAFASVDNCIKCLKAGAFDYIDKNSIQYDPYERLKKAIKEGLTARLTEPGDPFQIWQEQNREYLEEKYRGKHIAVIDQIVVDTHKDPELLKKRVKDNYPFFMAKLVQIQNSDKGES